MPSITSTASIAARSVACKPHPDRDDFPADLTLLLEANGHKYSPESWRFAGARVRELLGVLDANGGAR